MLRPLRLGATVRSARVTSAAERAWYGAFPLELKLPLFDSVAGKPGGASDPPSTYPHGILWEGTISSKKAGYLSLIGEFSLPRYIHGDAQTDLTVEWLNGDFEFELQVLWNTSDVSALNIQNSYSSPVYLGATKKYVPLQKETLNELFDVDGEFLSTPSLDIDPVVKRAPVILLGTYSADGTSFLWSGNLSVVIPDVVQVTPWSKSSYWSTANGDVPLEHLPWVPRKPEVEALPATAGASSALGVSVTGGNVTVTSNGTVMNWWSGKLPVAIPMPPFNRVIKAASKGTDKTDKSKSKPSYASGVVWDATLQRQDNVTVRLQGNFSVPIFIHGPGELFAIDWIIGKVSLDFKLLWNATLDGVFQEGHNYSSPIFFRATKSSDTATDIIVDMQRPGSVEGSAELQFVAASIAKANALSQAPIILHGSFSPEKTQFLWSGNATVILPAPSGSIRLQMTSSEPSPLEVTGKVAVGAEVIGGSIDAGVANSSSSTVWNGELPVPIRRPDLLGRGITWRGELIATSLTEAQLDGSFSTLLPGDAGFTFPITIYQGKFSLQLSLLWSVSVDGLLPPGATVYSPIYLRGTAAPDDAEAWFAVDQDPSRQQTETTLQKDTPGSLRVPIILQGAYSSDLTTFWWSGRIILAFPPLSSDKLQQLRLTKSRVYVPNNPPPGNSFMMMPMDENLSSASGPPAFRPLRLGASVSSARISNSTGSVWSGQLPLQLPVPLFDSFVEPSKIDATVSGPSLVYGHGVSWEGMLSTSSPGFLSFTGEFSILRYTHGGGLKNFAMHTSHGRFNIGLKVLWNNSDINNLNIKGKYFSPVFLGARQKYSHLQDVPAGSLSDKTNYMKSIPSNEIDVALKKAPIILLGMFSSDGRSFIWSGDVSLVIPDVVPVPTWTERNYWSEYNGVSPPGHLSSIPRRAEVDALSAVPASSSALGISATNGNVSVIANGSYVSWWNGSLPLSIPISAFNNVKITSKPEKYSKSKPKLSYVNGFVWDATLRRLDNTTLCLQGNFSAPIFIHGPGALFAIDRKVGNFTLDFKLRWNTTLEDVFQEGRKYSSPVFFRASKPTDSISDIITELQRPSSVKGGPYFQSESLVTVNASALLRAPIILDGAYSPDKTKFLWSGNATFILPKPSGSVLEMAVKERSGSEPSETANSGTVAIGAEVLDGDAVAGTSGSAPSKLWNGEIPVPIRRPDLLARGVTWKGEITKFSPTDVELNGTFSSLWTGAESPTFPFSVYAGNFSVKLGLLWNVSVDGLLPTDATVYSPIYLRGTTVPKESDAWLAEEDNNFQRMAVELAQPQEVVPALRVPIILQGTYSPDLTTFWWTGRTILVFPKPSIVPIDLQEIPVTKSSAVGATVTSGSVIAAGNAELWDGSLPVVLPPELETVVWNGALKPSVGGTVELRGLFYGQTGPGEFAFVLSPLWSTPLAGYVVPGRNYTSPLFLREPTDPAPWQGTSAVSEDVVPIILQGSFSSDKSSFSWSGNVIIAFP